MYRINLGSSPVLQIVSRIDPYHSWRDQVQFDVIARIDCFFDYEDTRAQKTDKMRKFDIFCLEGGGAGGDVLGQALVRAKSLIRNLRFDLELGPDPHHNRRRMKHRFSKMQRLAL